MGGMAERDAVDFWWLAGLPEQERRAVMRLWEQCEEQERVTVQKPFLVPAALAAKLAHVTRPYIYLLIMQGRLEGVKFQGRRMATLGSVRLYARERPKQGVRPVPEKPWTKKEEALLGTKTDRAVAELLGRVSFRVRRHRLELGIKSFRKNNRVRL